MHARWVLCLMFSPRRPGSFEDKTMSEETMSLKKPHLITVDFKVKPGKERFQYIQFINAYSEM